MKKQLQTSGLRKTFDFMAEILKQTKSALKYYLFRKVELSLCLIYWTLRHDDIGAVAV
jgi:hypothetical protein